MEESKMTLNNSVGYNCHQWLINRAVQLWETCSIKSAGQCVCQQIALVYFPWRLSPVRYLTCFISCPAWLHWCVSVVNPEVLSVSPSPKKEDLWPLTQDDPQLIRRVCVYQTSAPLTPLLPCLKNSVPFKIKASILMVSWDAEVGKILSEITNRQKLQPNFNDPICYWLV